MDVCILGEGKALAGNGQLFQCGLCKREKGISGNFIIIFLC